jgi:hypothetical protein
VAKPTRLPGALHRGKTSKTVTEDHENLPAVNVVVRNVGHEPAKSIAFGSSSSVESSKCSPILPRSGRERPRLHRG